MLILLYSEIVFTLEDLFWNDNIVEHAIKDRSGQRYNSKVLQSAEVALFQKSRQFPEERQFWYRFMKIVALHMLLLTFLIEFVLKRSFFKECIEW